MSKPLTLAQVQQIAEVVGCNVVVFDSPHDLVYFGHVQYGLIRADTTIPQGTSRMGLPALQSALADIVEAETDPAKIERLCVLVPNWTTLHAPSIIKELARLLREGDQDKPLHEVECPQCHVNMFWDDSPLEPCDNCKSAMLREAAGDKDFAPPFTCDNESPNSDRISFRDSNGKRIPEWVICNMLNATHNQ